MSYPYAVHLITFIVCFCSVLSPHNVVPMSPIGRDGDIVDDLWQTKSTESTTKTNSSTADNEQRPPQPKKKQTAAIKVEADPFDERFSGRRAVPFYETAQRRQQQQRHHGKVKSEFFINANANIDGQLSAIKDQKLSGLRPPLPRPAQIGGVKIEQAQTSNYELKNFFLAENKCQIETKDCRQESSTQECAEKDSAQTTLVRLGDEFGQQMTASMYRQDKTIADEEQSINYPGKPTDDVEEEKDNQCSQKRGETTDDEWRASQDSEELNSEQSDEVNEAKWQELDDCHQQDDSDKLDQSSESDEIDQSESWNLDEFEQEEDNTEPNDYEKGGKKTYLSDEQRIEIVTNFMKIKNRFYESDGQEKRSFAEIDKQIAAQFGVNARTIYKWKKKFGIRLIGHKKREKIKILKHIKTLRKRNPQMTIAEIEEELPSSQYYKKEIQEAKKQLEIIEKFDKIKTEKERPLSLEEKAQIAAQLGVKIRTIYQWKNKMGLNEEQGHTKKEKLKLLMRYQKLKSDTPQMTEAQLLKKLQISQSTFYAWRRQFNVPIKKHFISEDEKHKIIKKYDKMKGKKTQSISRKEKKQIAEKLGVTFASIYRWKKKFGLKQECRSFKLTEKIQILQKYYRIKRKNPKMGDKKIAKMLEISSETIRKWKNAFGEQIEKEKLCNDKEDTAKKMIRTKSHSQLISSENNRWKWNCSTGTRTERARNF